MEAELNMKQLHSPGDKGTVTGRLEEGGERERHN